MIQDPKNTVGVLGQLLELSCMVMTQMNSMYCNLKYLILISDILDEQISFKNKYVVARSTVDSMSF